jgi:hypothetical protein
MHLSENEGIEGKTFVVTGGLGFVGSALCLELIRRGAEEVRAFDLRQSSPWSHVLNEKGVNCIQGWFGLLILDLILVFIYLFIYLTEPILSLSINFGKRGCCPQRGC